MRGLTHKYICCHIYKSCFNRFNVFKSLSFQLSNPWGTFRPGLTSRSRFESSKSLRSFKSIKSAGIYLTLPDRKYWNIWKIWNNWKTCEHRKIGLGPAPRSHHTLRWSCKEKPTGGLLRDLCVIKYFRLFPIFRIFRIHEGHFARAWHPGLDSNLSHPLPAGIVL